MFSLNISVSVEVDSDRPALPNAGNRRGSYWRGFWAFVVVILTCIRDWCS
jgi:hypothetical protein